MERQRLNRKEIPRGLPALLGLAAVSCLLAFSASLLSAANASASSPEPKKGAESWERWVLKGNIYRGRDRTADALRIYQTALKIQEKQDINDVRKAIVINDIADCYRAEDNMYAARMQEVHASTIYQAEIEHHQLGYEYGLKKPIDFNSGSLRPRCYICHENWKVVPILYGKSTGYDGEVPSDDDPHYTHKPGGAIYADQRWYCRDCHQSF